MTAGRSVSEQAEAAMARKLSGPAREEISLAPVLAALSDPVRFEIVCKLASGCELSCASLGLPIPKSTLTHHLKVLREAGVIVQRPVGTSKMTCLRRKDLDARFPGLLDSVLAARAKRPSKH
jgi:DNA-binding transcriptional ArsR family regulator